MAERATDEGWQPAALAFAHFLPVHGMAELFCGVYLHVLDGYDEDGLLDRLRGSTVSARESMYRDLIRRAREGRRGDSGALYVTAALLLAALPGERALSRRELGSLLVSDAERMSPEVKKFLRIVHEGKRFAGSEVRRLIGLPRTSDRGGASSAEAGGPRSSIARVRPPSAVAAGHAEPPQASASRAEDRALAYLLRAIREKKPIPTKADCAKAAGVSRQATSKWAGFNATWQRAKASEKAEPRRGRRDARTGDLDAEAD